MQSEYRYFPRHLLQTPVHLRSSSRYFHSEKYRLLGTPSVYIAVFSVSEHPCMFVAAVHIFDTAEHFSGKTVGTFPVVWFPQMVSGYILLNCLTQSVSGLVHARSTSLFLAATNVCFGKRTNPGSSVRLPIRPRMLP